MKVKASNRSYCINNKINNKDISMNLNNINEKRIKTKTYRDNKNTISIIKNCLNIKFKHTTPNKIVKLNKKSIKKFKKSKNTKKIISTTFEKCLNKVSKVLNYNLENRNTKFNPIKKYSKNFNSYKENDNSYNKEIKQSIKKIVIQKNDKLYNNRNLGIKKNLFRNDIIINNNNNLFEIKKSVYYFELKKLNFIQFKYYFFENLKYLKMKKNIILNKSFNKKINFKFENSKPILILDLDETLIHTFETENSKFDAFIEFSINDIDKEYAFFNIRPHLTDFINYIKDYYNIVIFTASEKQYADKILNYLDPQNKYFYNRLYRNNCLKTFCNNYIKDLSIFNNYDINKILIVDNYIFSFINNLKNGIIILPFEDNKNDKELLKLIDYLKYLRNFVNPIKANHKHFNYLN